MSVVEYVNKMRSLADKMTSAGKKLDDEEIVSYILAGLDTEFNLVVSAITTRVESITLGDALVQLSTFESRREIVLGGGHSNSYVNMASHGGKRWL